MCIPAAALEAYKPDPKAAAASREGASAWACVDAGQQLRDGSRMNSYSIGNAALTGLRAAAVSKRTAMQGTGEKSLTATEAITCSQWQLV